MFDLIVAGLKTLNQLLTAGIAITAFSLLLYALTFNLRDRVARSFAMVLVCVAVVFVSEAAGSISTTSLDLTFWLKFQWVGVIFLPIAYLHFSDALLTTTGRPSRGRRILLIRLNYGVAILFMLALMLGWLVGPLNESLLPAPHLERTPLFWLFSLFYVTSMAWALVNFWRAFRRTRTTTSRRRMLYLLAGSSAPALGSFPYLLFGPNLAAQHPFVFWLSVAGSNMLVAVLLVLMAYSVAFFGVSWPDRVVKRRLFKWLLRGPGTASLVLTFVTITRRIGESFGQPYAAAVPVVMAGSILILEYMITLAAPYWERWLFHGGDRASAALFQTLEDRLVTSGDLRQFLEAILISVCDRLQSEQAFIFSIGAEGKEMVVTAGTHPDLPDDFAESLPEHVSQNGSGELFAWGNYWLLPLFSAHTDEPVLLGLMGIRHPNPPGAADLAPTPDGLEADQRQVLSLTASRAAMALEDRAAQQRLFNSLEALNPEFEIIQRLRAASRYEGDLVMAEPELPEAQRDFPNIVKDALTHYWGGPKLLESPLMRLGIVQNALAEHQNNPANALRAILHNAIEQVRPEGERRFTGEWMLYNILEMKFMEGHKVREIALRLAMSEADLYRKQRVAIETVARTILEMEKAAQEEAKEVHAGAPPKNGRHV